MSVVGTRRMRAARIVAPCQIEIENVEVQDPGPRDVRFRVQGCGICASNLGPWFGLPWTKYPLGPGESGHEAWGVVEDVGKEVTTVNPGDLIAAVSYNAYAEYDIAPQDALVRLPSAFADVPFPGEPLGCAMNIYERSRIRAGQVVAIIGIGFLGAILIRLASLAGAKVIAISRRPFSLSLAREMGATEVIPMEDHHAIIERVKEVTNGRLCD
ncbi:MAG TPA: zinc-binding dehydrogenase, partial [Polyangiaceae bacterium]|nr:zinc-binding dehydrogenase [Polyangiaceae bacterium]